MPDSDEYPEWWAQCDGYNVKRFDAEDEATDFLDRDHGDCPKSHSVMILFGPKVLERELNGAYPYTPNSSCPVCGHPESWHVGYAGSLTNVYLVCKDRDCNCTLERQRPASSDD